MTVLEVGCGDDPDPRATMATDIRPTASADAQADIYDLPLCDDSAEGLIARHVVEHLLQPELALEEVARVVKPGGWVEIRVPVGVNAANDGDHDSDWTWERPEQYSRAHRRGWDPDLPLRLVDRDLNVWLMGPWSALSPLFQLAARRWPAWAAYRAGGGELVARYKVEKKRDRDADVGHRHGAR